MKPVIIGAGLAGLSAALALSPMPVTLISPRKLGEECSSALAQGGIAASVGVDDNAASHAADTIKVGGGLCDSAIVGQVTADAAQVIKNLVKQGVVFDRDTAGQLQLGLEAAHSHRRIVHAADATGAAIMKALVRAARATPSIEIIEDAVVLDIAVNGHVRGVTIIRNGDLTFIPTDKIVLATGGAGALWQHTTNPLSSWGQGLALAARAGAELCDLEFMQFHPTAIDIGRDPMPLASEALRGEGAVLINDKDEHFIDELQPRDIVARAIQAQLDQGHKVFLDARDKIGAAFPQRFPGIYALCIAGGIDPVTMPIPVRPAAHYHMGGIKTDVHGRSSVKGLWACGEVASTGLHGANRLASNSLLEAASFGKKVAEDILKQPSPSPLRGVPPSPAMRERVLSASGAKRVREIMSRHVSVTRDAAGLQQAVKELTPLAHHSDMALAALMISVAALRREESRGAHVRKDFPAMLPEARHQVLTLADILPQPLALGA